jgi:glucosamine-6-phosphate deaminase
VEEAMNSKVEQIALELAGEGTVRPPRERVGVIVVNSFPALGTLTAARFIEWAQEHPEGVIARPTGKTPEYFIREMNRFLTGWKRKETQQELAEWGVNPGARKCNLRGLRFVQIDEFYPSNPLHHNSFYHYVNKFYIEGFDLDPAKALLIDCSRVGLPPGR